MSYARYDRKTVSNHESSFAKLSLVTIAWSKLTKEELENTKRGRRLVKSKRELTEEIKRLEMATGDARRNVGNYGSALDKLGGRLKRVIGIGAALTIGRDVIQSNIELEESLASLQAITGVADDAFDGFKDKIVEVGNEQKKSFAEVAKGFEIIGSAKPELLSNADGLAQVTDAAILLSKATKSDLEPSALSLAGTLNQFGLGAEEAGRVINILAAGSQAGAAPVQDITIRCGSSSI